MASQRHILTRPQLAARIGMRIAKEEIGRTDPSSAQARPGTASVMIAEEYRDIGTPSPWQKRSMKHFPHELHCDPAMPVGHADGDLAETGE